MNNEPVAWISENDLMNICHKHPYVSRDKILDDDIPLYTHPAKTLTDEEIIEITIRWFGSSRNDFFPEQWLDYARAILRKEQEK